MTARRSLLRLGETLVILVFCAVNLSPVAEAVPVISKTQIVGYLSEFGYLQSNDPKNQEPVSEEAMSKAISTFQSFMKIGVTGKIDMKTISLMTLPRCGVQDKVKTNSGKKSEAYELFGPKWGHNRLTYKITRYPRTLERSVVDHEIARAFNVWSGYTDLTFTPQNGQVDIEIMFVSGSHGDQNPFDGPAGYGRPNVLAHAYSPGLGIGGDTHFDNDEVWTINSNHGSNLFQVAAHEFGHALGLDHSTVYAALMAPVYRGFESDFSLHSDDISGIQAIYGRKRGHQYPPVYGDPNVDDNSVDPQRGQSPWTNWWNYNWRWV